LIPKANWLSINVKYLAILLLLTCIPLTASVGEYSAMANALSGITLLSDSVADYAISPVMAQKGLSTFYNRPFNSSELTILGLHNAVGRKNIFVGVGTTYLHHEDYVKHEPYLNLNYRFHGLGIGATGHMMYDSVKGEDGEFDFAYDLGAAYIRGDYGLELKLLRGDSADEQLAFGMKAALSPEVTTALGYVKEKNHDDYFRFGIAAELHEYVSLYGSWQNEPNRFGMGVQLNLDSWSVMYSVRTHTALDPTHAISLDIYW
jgi:hypothetical protein